MKKFLAVVLSTALMFICFSAGTLAAPGGPGQGPGQGPGGPGKGNPPQITGTISKLNLKTSTFSLETKDPEGNDVVFAVTYTSETNFLRDLEPAKASDFSNGEEVTIRGIINPEEKTLKANGIFFGKVPEPGSGPGDGPGPGKGNGLLEIVLQVNTPKIWVNRVEKPLEVSPEITYGRMFVPIRVITEAIGAHVEWIASQQKVIITYSIESLNKIQKVELYIGKNRGVVNGEAKLVDDKNNNVVPYIKNGRTMLPIRFIAESLLAKDILWNDKTNQATFLFIQ